MTAGPRRAGDEGSQIAVGLEIGDPHLWDRVAAIVRESAGLFAAAADLATADVVVTDRWLDCSRPAILIAPAAVTVAALERGYAGALSPAFSDAQLRIAITAAAHGLICTGPTSLRQPSDRAGVTAALTPRETDVLDLLMTGASNKEMARQLEISIHTVKFHVAAIIAKLGAKGRTDAVARALKTGKGMV